MRRIVFGVSLSILVLTIIVWLVTLKAQPTLPWDVNNGLYLFFVALTGTLAAISGFKDAIDLWERLTGTSGPAAATHPARSEASLVDPSCGDRAIDLADSRLEISTAFGAYFAGLLERENSYINLRGQIEAAALSQQRGLEPLQQLIWALHYARGPQVLVIAGDGGMGKSTLAAKLVRCLFQEQTVDLILGDSAKTQTIDPITGKVTSLDPAFYNSEMFVERICSQLGLPYQQGQQTLAIQEIHDRLVGRRAVMVVDNLETISRGSDLLLALQKLTNRSLRVIATTRTVTDLRGADLGVSIVQLKPIRQVTEARDFIGWHIQTHASQHPRLATLEPFLNDTKKVALLLQRTGGHPLLMQLVVSGIAQLGWDYVRNLPQLFGPEMLDYLYRERWEAMRRMALVGETARRVLRFVSGEQYRGRKITLAMVNEWAVTAGYKDTLLEAMKWLQEQFLIVNHDPVEGSLAVFPSLAEFLKVNDER